MFSLCGSKLASGEQQCFLVPVVKQNLLPKLMLYSAAKRWNSFTAGFSVVCRPGVCWTWFDGIIRPSWFDSEVTKLDSTIDEIAKSWTKTWSGEWYFANIYTRNREKAKRTVALSEMTLKSRRWKKSCFISLVGKALSNDIFNFVRAVHSHISLNKF